VVRKLKIAPHPNPPLHKGREQISLRNKIKKGVKFLPLAKGEVRRG
jgi:hypothetical protein